VWGQPVEDRRSLKGSVKLPQLPEEMQQGGPRLHALRLVQMVELIALGEAMAVTSSHS
jgi:hypothetical protein